MWGSTKRVVTALLLAFLSVVTYVLVAVLMAEGGRQGGFAILDFVLGKPLPGDVLQAMGALAAPTAIGVVLIAADRADKRGLSQIAKMIEIDANANLRQQAEWNHRAKEKLLQEIWREKNVFDVLGASIAELADELSAWRSAIARDNALADSIRIQFRSELPATLVRKAATDCILSFNPEGATLLSSNEIQIVKALRRLETALDRRIERTDLLKEFDSAIATALSYRNAVVDYASMLSQSYNLTRDHHAG